MKTMKRILTWFAIFIALGAVAAYAANNSNPIFNNVTVNGLLQLNGQIGKFKSKGNAPAINSCGTNPSVAGTDNSMLLTMGSGTLTTCSVTFATPWPQAPHCVAFPQNATAAATGTTVARISSIDVATLTFTGSNLTSAAYEVLCW